MEYVINFTSLGMQDLGKVGGKNASLGEMTQSLIPLGVKIPEGFATTTEAYKDFLKKNELDTKIMATLSALDYNNVSALKKASTTIKHWILTAPFSSEFMEAIKKAYENLHPTDKTSFAVRSSATFEDLPTASFAGQQDSFLNIRSSEHVITAIKKVFASLFNERAIVYRFHNKFPHEKVAISAGVQRMVRSDLAASGVMFTIDTESGFDQVVFINANYGLGETVVQGIVNPDEFYVYKPGIKNNKFAVLQRYLGDKTIKIIYGKTSNSGSSTKTMRVSKKDRNHFSITDQEATELARYAMLIEKHYGKAMDIEWAKDGIDGQLYIVQARPETVKSQEKHNLVERFILKEKGEVLLTGHSVGQRIGAGKARIINDPKHMNEMQDKEVLIADMTDPDWEPIMEKASAIITNRGGRTCHAAIVARELGIPAVVGCDNATKLLKTGEPITVSCAEGEVGYIYRGILPFTVDHVEVEKMPPLPIELYLNLANPDRAFTQQFLPNHGVGLVRLEFIISNTIGIHPKALLKFNTLPKNIQNKISRKITAYESPVEFYIEKLREGISTIAAAFYPKPIIVRLSDFKSNEYANLLGGKLFEPKEENPMIGFRGVSRYIAETFQDCFALECEAIKRVRDKMGLVNVEVMFPFVRTVNEMEKAVNLLAQNNLKRGENGLKIIMMCEIPSNALIAKEFLKYCDGFSVGSNDLTQLTLGLDRDSALVADLFDERNPAVKVLLHQAISACKEEHKYIGICGQAPSDYPDLAKWLMQEGITGISLNPDTIVETWLYLAK